MKFHVLMFIAEVPTYTIHIRCGGPWPPGFATRWNRYDLHPSTPISTLFSSEGKTRPDTGLMELGGDGAEHYLADVARDGTRVGQTGWPTWVCLRPCERLPKGFDDWMDYFKSVGM
jgi:hypothetical protein